MREVVAEQNLARPLSTVATGGTVRLFRVGAGRRLNSRLASMGFVPNVEVRVVSNSHPGPFVVVIKDVKMVLGRGVAKMILVR